MFKKKTLLYFLPIFILGVFPLISTDFFNIHKEKLAASFDIIRTLCIVVGALLAIIYFDPSGIRKKRIEKQYDNVILILERLVGAPINIFAYDFRNGERTFSAGRNTYLSKSEIDRILTDDNKFLHRPIWLEFNEYVEVFGQLFKLQNNIWTPVEIANKIKFLNFGSFSGVGDSHEDHTLLKWNKKKYEHELISNRFGNDRIVTFEQFIVAYKNIILECENWLKRNSFSGKGLNL